MKYRSSKIVISLFMVVILLTLSFICAFASESGSCGTSANWSFDPSTGELKISGSGPMTSYSNSDYVPWRTYTDKITKITIDEGITKIGNYAFKNCTQASHINIPESVIEIGYSAFDNCTSVRQITIPSSVEKINDAPFYGCTKLTEIYVEESNRKYSSDDSGVLYNKEKTHLIQYPAGNVTKNFSVPYTVATIKPAAFAGNRHIRNVVMAESVNIIDYMAFYECTSLSCITISKEVTLIGEMAFSKCGNLSEVYYTGTQSQWGAVAVRDNNTPLSEAAFVYEKSGPAILAADNAVTSSAEGNNDTSYSEKNVMDKFKNNIGIIPLILIIIAVFVVILIIILIRLIIKKHRYKS